MDSNEKASSTNFFTEQQLWGTTSYTVLEGSHTSFQTEKATIDLITNPLFGRMLFIDGVLQSTEGDEKLYHIPLIKLAFATDEKKSPMVLIAGGAEGATIREVQEADYNGEFGIEEIHMVDWDQQLVEHMRDNEGWSNGAFDDPRVHLHFEDIFVYLQQAGPKFDTIFLDLLDPTEAEEDWFVNLLNKAIDRLQKGGIIVANFGSDLELTKKIMQRLGYGNSRVSLTRWEIIQVPSFMQPWVLGKICCDGHKI
jgi:spermidine synthase